jgi:hypothetical protein
LFVKMRNTDGFPHKHLHRCVNVSCSGNQLLSWVTAAESSELLLSAEVKTKRLVETVASGTLALGSLKNLVSYVENNGGTRWRRRKVAGSISDGVVEIFNYVEHNGVCFYLFFFFIWYFVVIKLGSRDSIVGTVIRLRTGQTKNYCSVLFQLRCVSIVRSFGFFLYHISVSWDCNIY